MTTLLNGLRLILRAKIGSALENVPSTLERSMHLLLGGVLCLSARSGRFPVFESAVSLLTFCLVVLPITESGALMSPTVHGELFLALFLSVFVLCALGLCCLVHVCL